MGLFLNLEDDIKKLEKKIILNTSDDNQEKINESYELYNKAIDMIKNNCFTSAKKLLESAKLINSNDEDIINSIGLLNLLFCNFDEACESFYSINKKISNNLSEKYINIIISKEFKSFLEYYNLGIIKSNEGKYSDAVDIFLDIVDKESNLIEPYIILYSLYKYMGNNIKKDECINLIKILDRDNEILYDLYKEVNINKNLGKDFKKGTKYKNKVFIGISIFLIMLAIFYMYIKPKFNEDIFESENENITYKEENEEGNKKEDSDKDIDKIETENIKEDENLAQKENVDLLDMSEDELINKANNFKRDKNYKDAINVYKYLLKLNKNHYIVSEAIYQIAILNETIKNYDEAIKYYEKYIENYSTSQPYYDESYYNISMIYYNNNDIEKCKKYLAEFVSKNPNSIYNNSKVKEILEQ